MQRKKVFISSVQSEFTKERQKLVEFLSADALLGKFFDVFAFENLPAVNQNPQKVYIDEVKQCDIYLGLFGKEYGFEDEKGVSPTEREFDCAVENHKIKLVFITNHSNEERNPKEQNLIKKSEHFVVRKKFSNDLELKTSVYNSLVRFLEENEYIRTLPFDVTFNRYATIEDLDEEKIRKFVYVAHRKRQFPFTSDADIETMLTHLNLIENKRVTNAAILPFGMTVAKLKQRHNSIPVNPLIAEPLYLFGTIERMGTGTLDIIKKCKDAGLKEPEFVEEETFTVILWRNRGGMTGGMTSGQTGGQTSGQTSGQTITDTQEKIINVLIDNPKISRKRLSEILKINTSAIQKQIEKLKQMGIIEREGADFGGYWKIINKDL